MSIRRWIIIKRQEGKRQAKTRKRSYQKRNQNFQHQNCGSTKRQSEHFATLPSRLRVCVFFLPPRALSFACVRASQPSAPPCPHESTTVNTNSKTPLLAWPRTPDMKEETEIPKIGYM